MVSKMNSIPESDYYFSCYDRVSPAPPPPAASTSAGTGFVFGQNLHERVSVRYPNKEGLYQIRMEVIILS